MRRASLIIIFALISSGCARTSLSMFPGEKNASGGQNPTGAVAVLDPLTGQDVALVDQANSRSALGKRKVSTRTLSEKQMNARYGALLGGMPEQPKLFILYFKQGSTDLVDESGALLPDLFSEVKRRPGVDVQIVGHTDTVGEAGLNDSLSVKRAQEVKALLATFGLPAEIVRATGRGERELRETTADGVPSELNRRVEVYVK
jgi:outer membrane protein OmpA-like peptidoglycan-associated protein